MYVITGLGWGGAESQVIDLALSFASLGWSVEVVTLLADPERRDVLENAGIPVHSLGMTRGRMRFGAVLKLRAHLRRFRPYVVHAHMVHANLLSRFARLFAPIPRLITSAHNVNEGAQWRYWAYRVTDRLTDLTTNVSQAAVNKSVEMKAAPPSRIRFMPNGIDLKRFHQDVSARESTRQALGLKDEFVWLAVGSFEEQKDYPNLINAVKRLPAEVKAGMVVLVAGQGPLSDEISASIQAEGLGDTIRLLGVRSDVPLLMQGSDAYVMSSAWEGLPMVLLEAAASGLPIVATDVGGNSQIVRSGETGTLVASGDSERLSIAMAGLMEMSPDKRSEMGGEAAVHAQRTFGLDQVVSTWEALYVGPEDELSHG